MSRLLHIAQVVGFLAVAVSAVIVFVGCSEPSQRDGQSTTTSVLRDRVSEAEQLLAPGQYEEAVSAFEELRPQVAESGVRRARVLLGLGRAYFGREGLREGRFAGPAKYREDLETARRHLEAALEEGEQVRNLHPATLIGIHGALGSLMLREADYKLALMHFKAAKALLSESGDVETKRWVYIGLIESLIGAGRLAEASALCDKLHDFTRDSSNPRVRSAMGRVLMATGNFKAAKTELSMAQFYLNRQGSTSTHVSLQVEVHSNQAACALQQGEFQEAQDLVEKAVAGLAEAKIDPRTAAVVRANLGRMLLTLERLDEAEKILEGALSEQEALLGKGHPDAIQTQLNLATLARLRGDYEKAREHGLRALESAVALGEGNLLTGEARASLASIFLDEERYAKAVEEIVKALEVFDNALGRYHVRSVMICLQATLIAADSREHTAEGARQFRLLYPEAGLRFGQLQKDLKEDHLKVLTALAMFAEIRARTPLTIQEADQLLGRFWAAQEGFGRFYSDGALSIAQLRLLRGELMIQLKRFDQALQVLERAIQRLDPIFQDNPILANLLEVKARIICARPERQEEARRDLEEARRILQRRYGVGHPKVRAFDGRRPDCQSGEAESLGPVPG